MTVLGKFPVFHLSSIIYNYKRNVHISVFISPVCLRSKTGTNLFYVFICHLSVSSILLVSAHKCTYTSRPRSESGPILNWSNPDPNSDLGWTNLELGRPRSKFDLGQPK